MKALKTTLFLALIVLITTTTTAQKTHKEYYDNGNLKTEGQFDSNGKGTGVWKSYYENGKLERTGSYSNGNPNGEWKFYNDNIGWLEDIHDYKDGEKISLTKGCFSGDCENGYGKKFLGWGKRQEGNFTNGQLNGNGIEISTLSGIKNYEGNFLNGEKDGQGTETEIELRLKYVGQWKAGEKNGQGTETKYNALLGGILMEKYEGNWEDGKKTGKATMIEYDHLGKKEKRKLVGEWTWNDADKPSGTGKEYVHGELVYEGTFKNGTAFKTEGCVTGDCENGQGVFMFPDKRKYVGQFKNGQRNGLGFMLVPKKGFYMLTNYKNDTVEDGYVRIFSFNNELIFAVEMKDGRPVAKLSENGVDVGCIKGDCENGFGHYVWENGTKYIGEFKNGNAHGFGTVTWPEGKFIGSFNNGDRSGYGREYDKDIVLIKQGKWLDDVFYPNLTIEKNYSKNEKCTVGNCINGFGIFIETFEPGWSDAYRDYVNTYEIKYEGFWKDGKFHGLGFTEDRMAKTFVGLFENGQALK